MRMCLIAADADVRLAAPLQGRAGGSALATGVHVQ
jgi:hypothetical protein